MLCLIVTNSGSVIEVHAVKPLDRFLLLLEMLNRQDAFCLGNISCCIRGSGGSRERDGGERSFRGRAAPR